METSRGDPPTGYSPPRPWKTATCVTLMALSYLALAWFSLLFVVQPEHVAGFWLPNGVLVGAMLLRERRDCWCLLGGWRLRREPDHELLGWQFAWCQFGFRGGQWSGVVAGGVGIGALCRHTDHARFGAWGASCATLVLALVTVWFTAQGSGPIITSESFGTVRMLHGEDQSTIGQPCVILLDLNLPRMNGIKFPEELRRDAKLKDSVVFVLTTLNSDDDRVVTNSKYVAGCLLKSEADADFGQLFRCVQPVLRFSDN